MLEGGLQSLHVAAQGNPDVNFHFLNFLVPGSVRGISGITFFFCFGFSLSCSPRDVGGADTRLIVIHRFHVSISRFSSSDCLGLIKRLGIISLLLYFSFVFRPFLLFSFFLFFPVFVLFDPF